MTRRGTAGAGVAAVWLAGSGAVAQPLGLDVRAVNVSAGFEWGYHAGLKQPLGTVLHGRAAHQVSRRIEGTDGSPDALVWVNDRLGTAYVLPDPTGHAGDPVINPGGMAAFHAEPTDPSDLNRLWLVYGGRANDLPFSLFSADATLSPHDWSSELSEFVTDQGSSTPCIHVRGDRLAHFYRNGPSSGSSTTVRLQRYRLGGPSPALESELALASGMQHPPLGKIGIEQLWTRYDPRHGALLATWQWFLVDEHRFGSNPVVVSRDLGVTWEGVDGRSLVTPLVYADMDPVLMPDDHLGRGGHTGWHVRDLGLGPAGAPWITLPDGDVDTSGAWRLLLHRWDGSAWNSAPMTGGMHGRSKAHACGATRHYLVLAYSEEAARDRLLLKYSADDGATWAGPFEIDSVGGDAGSQTICWVSYFQPAERFADNTARFLVGYYRDADGEYGREYRNRLRYVRVRLGPRTDLNGDGLADTRDVLEMLGAFARAEPDADFNDDGATDTTDVLDFLNAWVTERG